jgi:hypothetical protein
MNINVNVPIIDLAYCETRVLLLHPGRLYRFTPHSDCERCMTLMKQHDIACGTESKVLDTSEPKEQFAYSRDQENYYGSFDTRGDAVAEGIDGDADLDEGRSATIWTGRVRPVETFLDKMSAHRIGERALEDLDMALCDEIYSEDEILSLTVDQQEALGLLILDFVKHNASFNRWGVDQIQEHTGVKE